MWRREALAKRRQIRGERRSAGAVLPGEQVAGGRQDVHAHAKARVHDVSGKEGAVRRAWLDARGDIASACSRLKQSTAPYHDALRQQVQRKEREQHEHEPRPHRKHGMIRHEEYGLGESHAGKNSPKRAKSLYRCGRAPHYLMPPNLKDATYRHCLLGRKIRPWQPERRRRKVRGCAATPRHATPVE